MRPFPDALKDPVSTGTTLMAVEFSDGVVIAADSRTSMGSYVFNRVTDKLTKITDRIYCCRSGSAADTQTIADVVAYHLDFHEMQFGKPASVKTAANVFRELCYEYRDQMSAGIICAGWDEKEGGQVFTLPLGGALIRQPVSLAGSGSMYINGYADSQFKEKMTKEECVDFCLKGIALAIKRDGASGGVCRIAVITKEGVERRMIPHDKLPQY